MGFRDYVQHDEFVEKLLNEFQSPSGGSQYNNTKPWSAKKDEIMAMWQKMRPDMPIIVTPMVQKADGSTQSYGEDGIRITGSFSFISSVLGRLKEILYYENPQTKLRLILRGIDKTRDTRPDRNSYVFYLNVERRSHGKPGRPKKNKLEPPKLEPPKLD